MYLGEDVRNNFEESRTGIVVVVVAHSNEVLETCLDVGAKQIAECLDRILGKLHW